MIIKNNRSKVPDDDDDDGDGDDDYDDDHDDSVCDDVPSSSIRVDKVIAGPDRTPPVLNNDPPQDASCTNLFFHKLPFCFLRIYSDILCSLCSEFFFVNLLT